MAERTSSRAGSRRTTPQPAPSTARVGTQSPPKRITRSARSQSRDISDSEVRKTDLKARRGAKQATPEGTNGVLGQSGPESWKGMPTNRSRIQQDLSTVAEDPSIVYPNLNAAEAGGVGENLEDAEIGQQPIQHDHKSPGGLSAFSGTTARISFPAQELTEVSPEDMLDTLPDLSDASEKLLSFVMSAELSKASIDSAIAQLQNKDTRENKKFKRLSDIFERQRKEYGGDSYINVGETLRRLLGRKAGPIDEQSARWRPDALLQKANLAILVSRMLSLAEQDQKDQFLEDIASTFPQPFAQRLERPENLTQECSALAEATCYMALEVRTHEAIMLLIRHAGKSNFDINSALLQIFYDANAHIKGWAVPGLRSADLTKEAKDIILERAKKLREAFELNVRVGLDGQLAGAESLRATFPWTTFAQQLIAWAGQRQTEIEIQTATYGGARAICQAIVDVVQGGRLRQSLGMDDVDDESDGSDVRLVYETPSELQATPEHQGQSGRPARANELSLPQFSAESNKLKTAASIVKRRQAGRKTTKATEQRSLPQDPGTTSDVQVASTAGPFMRGSTPHQDFYEQVNPSHVLANNSKGQPTSADQDDDRRSEGHEEEGHSIDIDRRKGQGSLAFRTQQEAESNKENVAERPESQRTKAAGKRSMYDRDPFAVRIPSIDGSDTSSDDGFQRQAKPSNAATQRRLISATKRPASKPASIQRRSPKKARVQEDTGAYVPDGNADVTGEQQEIEVPLSQAYGSYTRANESAKQKTAVGTKPPQKRSAWTSAETDMLLYLITEHGTSWKLLKEKDNSKDHVLEARDQVALKDKARNMKMDYLKAGRVLPGNFERIALSHLQITRLRDCGIEYDPETGTRVDAEVID